MKYSFLPFLLIAITLSSCGTTRFKNVREDSYAHPFGFAGASFECEGGGCSAGINKSKLFCENRPFYIVEEKSRSFIDTMVLPITNTVNHHGSITNTYSGARYNYMGSSTYTDYVPMTYTRTIHDVDFICADSDVFQKVYVLSFRTTDSPWVCTEVPEVYTPGKERLWRVAHEPGNEDCIAKEGWLRFLSASKDRKAHLFVGDKGWQLCRRMERELIDRNFSGSQADFHLQKVLVCSK